MTSTALRGIDAAILVGGKGTRLRGVIDDRPKPLAPVNERPFVTYLLDQLAGAGATNVVLCGGHLGTMLEETLGGEYRGLSLRYSIEATPLGTGGALRQAADRLTSDPVLVMNGDSYCEVDFAALVACYRQRTAEAVLTLTNVPETAAFGRVEVDGRGLITQFSEKGAQTGPGAINAGIYLISRTRLLAIPAGRPVSLEREIFPVWIGQGMIGWDGGGRFLDIGTPETFRAATEFLESISSDRSESPQ